MYRTVLLFMLLIAVMRADAAAQWQEADWIVPDFTFRSGEHHAKLRLHYATRGMPRRDAAGHVTNAVLILHGTGGSGQQFLLPQFADVLFAKGGLLDPEKYYIVLPDGIGHGKSSKPSDGLRAKFPHYDYDDMVEAQYRLLSEELDVDHLRLVMGTSMGCMHSFVWGETHPQFMDALMPLACLPVQIAGRNRIWRRLAMDAITEDPDWMGGDYPQQPQRALRTAVSLLLIAGSAPLRMQADYPDRDTADAWLAERVPPWIASLDANDLLYQIAASRNYDPSKQLESIAAPLTWINSADDYINPPELGIAEREVRRIPHGKFVLLPASVETHGHGTHTWAVFWQQHLAELLKETERE